MRLRLRLRRIGRNREVDLDPAVAAWLDQSPAQFKVCQAVTAVRRV